MHKLKTAVENAGSTIKQKLSSEVHSHTHHNRECGEGLHKSIHRFGSFAQRRDGNDVKWFVDGCSYFWAVSIALQNAKESIWILDWWLSPELYLRRPPSKNEQYRVDRMLKAAADRGVQVHIIVYKEVTQALTLSSAHTKHHLEALSPNISVFRHPDHVPDAKALSSQFLTSLQSMKLSPANAAKLPIDAVKSVYGMGEDTVLYWAHHEKLCLIDGQIAFMGGLDLCFGRWDTWQHSIADVHPGDIQQTLIPGQDYNNARIMDFQDVDQWQKNKLDRLTNCRMGWSDVSLSISGPVVGDLKRHFVQRWNFIFDEKYNHRSDKRYFPLTMKDSAGLDAHHHLAGKHGDNFAKKFNETRERMKEHLEQGHEESMEELEEKMERLGGGAVRPQPTGNVECQIMRSCCKWSHGVPVEHSIANAYIETIKNSKKFIYIENQFFITATSDDQKPIKNKIAAAIVERVVRAAKANEKFKIIVVIPAVPAFAGDLRTDEALATRAIMEFQYDSINRGEHSILESISLQGVDPMEYIRFYNLRNYDRINVNGTMKKVEEESGLTYDDAVKEHEDEVGAGYEGEGHGTDAHPKKGKTAEKLKKYQEAADKIVDPGIKESSRWDSISECYMLGGEDIHNVPWEPGNIDEIDAIVSEQLYIHTKLLIADDRVVICGSANLNDRSQLGSHDSEIAIFVDDQADRVDSLMDGQPWPASRFAASLRRQLFRKHLGLVPAQDPTHPTSNFQPIGVPNEYDWGSEEDRAVQDPLSNEFLSMWNWRARNNTDAFAKVFHPVPYDGVKTWKEYDDWYEKYFGKAKSDEKSALKRTGHVVKENFSQGEQGLKEVKDILSTIKGTLVEMPLLFLKDEDIAKEGVSLNAFTEEVYT